MFTKLEINVAEIIDMVCDNFAYADIRTKIKQVLENEYGYEVKSVLISDPHIEILADITEQEDE